MKYLIIITVISVIIAIAAFTSLVRVRDAARRLTAAIRRRDISRLGAKEYRKAPFYFRELEEEVFEQLFRAKKLMARIDRRDKLLASVVEGLGDAVLVVDRHSRIRFANQTALDLFGWEADPIHKKSKELIRNEDLTTMLGECFMTRSAVNGTIRVHSASYKDSPERILDVDIAPLERSDTNTLTRIRIVLRDVTDVRQLEQVRQDFVANASHELRTPLTIINGYLETFADGGLDDRESALRFVAVMQKHGDRLARLVEDMLAISKLESTEEESLQFAPFEFKDCVEDVIERLSPLIEEKRAKVKVSLGKEENPVLIGDRFYWDQILFNLIENALKENDEDGLRIAVRIRRVTDTWEVRVTDNGRGIPQQDLPFIFKRFFRVEKHHPSEKKGTGLGLSIVRRAVEAHRGAIEAHSVPGVETAFIIRVPMELENAPKQLADSDHSTEPALVR
ncbi:MAG: ATP-binding protein [Verrucomicrobiota bacterium]